MKKINFLVILFGLLFSAACGVNVCEGNDFITKQGICVFNRGFDVEKSHIEYVIDVVEEEVKKKYKYTKEEMRDQYHDTSITFYTWQQLAEECNAGGQTQFEYGLFQDDYFKIWASYSECLTLSSLGHEILHVVNITVEGVPEKLGKSTEAHPKGWFMHKEYTEKEDKNSLEYSIFNRLWYEMCPGETGFVTPLLL